MEMASREIVHRTLEFANPPRAPRQMWQLRWPRLHYPNELDRILHDFPDDIIVADSHLRQAPVTQGDPWMAGEYVDEWGCTFTNIMDGIVGEVKHPPVQDWARDAAKLHIPVEWLTVDTEAVNRDCAASDKFILAGCCPRPFEQLQFIRGTAQLYMDLFAPPPAMEAFMRRMHQLYCDQVLLWASKTDVDGIAFIDDWGSQRTLLINPDQWRTIFRPMYQDYINIARAYGKKTFMHSDGNILAIYPDLIEMGLEAINSQIFCMGLENLEPFAGKITFWGEIDRQHLLPNGTRDQIAAAVREVHARLWKNGGCIAQCEFGAGANPDNVDQVFATWEELFKVGNAAGAVHDLEPCRSQA